MIFKKTTSEKQRAREKGQGETLHPLPLFLLFNTSTKTSRKRHEMGQSGEIYQPHAKSPTNANNKPTRAKRGETMTADELERLKQAQRQAIKGGNLAELNRINKILFDERERRQKERARAREQEREKHLSAKICSFCEETLSAENEREL